MDAEIRKLRRRVEDAAWALRRDLENLELYAPYFGPARALLALYEEWPAPPPGHICHGRRNELQREIEYFEDQQSHRLRPGKRP